MEERADNISEQGWCPVGTPGIVAIAVMLATFMEVLDSTVVNVSLSHIAGNLSATIDESTWVLTSYLVSNAIVLPATGWLSMLFGRKRYYMLSVAAFVVSSFLCGFARSLDSLILYRVLQGLGGGALQPISQAILLECFPVNRRGMGMAIFGVGVVFAPIIGPTLGGWITDNYSWRWIFYINIPIGILSMIMAQIYVVDPPYLRRGTIKVDYIGLGLLALGIGFLQVVLDTGQKHDWFQTSWILHLSIISAVSLIALVVWELYTQHPIIDLTVFKVRNYAPGVFLIFMLGIALYASMVLQPVLLQTLLGYSAMQSGLAMSPGGIGTLFCMPIVGYLVGKWDSRYMIIFGLSLLSLSMFIMSGYNLQISFWDAAYPRIIMGVGLAFLFVPLATVTFAFLSQEKTGNATGIFNLLRNIGGSVGIAGVNTLLARREQFHQSRLVENISTFDPTFQQWFKEAVAGLTAAGQSYLNAQKQAVAVAYQMVIRQSAMMSFVDTFWLLGVVMILLVPLVFLMRRPQRSPQSPTAVH
ncbi:DHA2 family efflux MFS transporter permease subunit [bacterium]|nr:DHA2 family efflux MFS transporter permease subunit [bacterium]